MNKIICLGEALIDMLNTEHTQYEAFVGGAPANVAVGIAKLNGLAKFIGQVGNDKFGASIIEFLSDHKVDVQELLTHPHAKTALAFVQLDETGDRSFSFYREQTADVLMDKSQLSASSFTNAAVLHMCSNTLTTQTGFELSIHALNLAKQNGALVSFDLNLRDELWPEAKIDFTKVASFIEQADVVKFAAEELAQMCSGDRQDYIQSLLDSGVRLVLITDGAGPVQYFTQSIKGSVIVPKTEVVDTTGAGDSFVAGLLTALANLSAKEDFTADQQTLERCISFATQCSAVTVSRYGACASFPVMTEVTNHHGLF